MLTTSCHLFRSELRGLRRDATALIELMAFVVCCLLIFRLAVPDDAALPSVVMLWITLVFGGVAYAGHLFDREWAGDGSQVLDGLRQLPHVLSSLFWVKWLTTCGVLGGVAVLGTVLLGATETANGVSMALRAWPPLLCGVAGLTALEVLFAAAVVREGRRSFLLALLCYPLAIPLILAVSQCLATTLATQLLDRVWFKLTAGTALLYVLVASLLFPLVMDE